jgi:hypothetical protein
VSIGPLLEGLWGDVPAPLVPIIGLIFAARQAPYVAEMSSVRAHCHIPLVMILRVGRRTPAELLLQATWSVARTLPPG